MSSFKTYTLSDEAKEIYLDKTSAVLGRHPEIIFGYAFGSFLADAPFRDLDIAVYVGTEGLPPIRYTYEDCLAQEISAHAGLPCPVDLRIFNDAPVALQFHAFRGILLLDRNPEVRFTRFAHIVARYLDIRPFLKHYLREAYGRA
jgi:predicted nucleotidyltransferase